jgi:hypothetical protein
LPVTLWTPLTTLAACIPGHARREAAKMARRWTHAAKADSRLPEDLIRLGNVLAGQPAVIENGWPAPNLPDPQRLAYEAGRRDMALQLLALMSLTPYQLTALVKEPDYDVPLDD